MTTVIPQLYKDLLVKVLRPRKLQITTDLHVMNEALDNAEKLEMFSYQLQSTAILQEKRLISMVEFPRSRYGQFMQRINFTYPVSISMAIRTVEYFFSLPLTMAYYEEIKSDLSDNLCEFKCRGDALGCAKFLDSVKLQTIQETPKKTLKNTRYLLTLIIGS